MKQLKLLIIILSLFALGLLIVLIILGTSNKKQENNTTIINAINTVEQVNAIYYNDANYESQDAPTVTYNTSVKEVTDDSTLYSIQKNINKYFQYIKDNNIQAVNELGGNSLYAIQNNVNYAINQAYLTENKYMKKYYTSGILTVANGDFTATEQEIYLAVYISLDNNSYKIETITDRNVIALGQEENVELSKQTYNGYELEYVNDVKQMEIYLDNFLFQIWNNTEKSYELLNEEYRGKRFGDINEYVKFLNEKQEQFSNIEITQYTVDKENDYTLYKGTDTNGNYYYILAKAYMEYEIVLDNYTLEDYSNKNDQEKIAKNVQKFILMLNSADYTNAYNLLNENFKLANFTTEEEFINYIKSNWFKRNIISSIDILEDGSCNAIIQETLSMESNKIQKNFKVTLGEGMNFTIEFNI